jgi:polysaccharide biosynthesis protein PelD
VLDTLRRGHPYLLELGGGLLVLAVVNVLLRPRDPGFLAVQPNPALLLVAVVACRHGLRAGLASGLATAAVVAACIVARLDYLTFTELRTLGHYVTPLLLIGTGFGLGAQRESLRRAERALEGRVEALEHELADQAVRFMAATEAKHELERRVADERASLSSLYTAARALETLDAERLYPAIALTARRFLEADACQCYVLEGELMRLRAAEGPAPERSEIPPDEGLVGLAVRLGRPVSVRDASVIASLDDLHAASLLMAAPLLGPHGTLLGCITVTALPFLRLTAASLDDLHAASLLMAAPLLGPHGTLLGCITVTALPFLRLTAASLDRLGLVADWGARALANARTHQETRARTIEDDLVGAYTYAYYERRLQEEETRADRYGRPLAVVVFRIQRFGAVAPERRIELGRVLSLVFSRTLRDVDIVCRYATEDSFAIILPETPPANAEVVVERLSREIANFHFAPYADETQDLEFSARVLAVRERPGGVTS